MVNQQLADYVNQSRQNSATDDQIRQQLLSAGWTELDVQSALELSGLSSPSASSFDQYDVNAFTKKWSWGGFGLGWIYFLANRLIKKGVLYLLGLFVPILNIVIVIKAGLRGRKMTWESGKWADFGQYQKRQRLLDKIAITLLILSILSWVAFGVYSILNKDTISNNGASLATNTPMPSSVFLSSEDQAWDLFQKVLAFTKAHDISGLESISYKPNNTYQECLKQMSEAECDDAINGLLDFVYEQDSKIKRSDLTNISQDDKQLIMYTNPAVTGEGAARSWEVRYLFFIKTPSGLKFLSESLLSQSVTSGSQQVNDQEAIQNLQDSDKDGIPDLEEKCGGASQYDKKCIKTDPNNKDTDSNGWWDGVDEKLKS